MRAGWIVAGVLLAGCGDTDEYDEPQGAPVAEVTGEIRTIQDLEPFGGQIITVEGVLGLPGPSRGRHASVTMDSGLVVYVPHAEHYWQGENWWNFEGKRVQVTGELHIHTSSAIDGLYGPFLNDPSYPSLASEQISGEAGAPRESSEGN